MALADRPDDLLDDGPAAALELYALAVAERCRPPVAVRDADAVLEALLAALAHLAPVHEPCAPSGEVAVAAFSVASVAAAAATAFAGPADGQALEAALPIAAWMRPADAPQTLAWTRMLIDLGAAALQATVDVVIDGSASPSGPDPAYEHAPTPREDAREALVTLLAACLQALVAFGPDVTTR